MPEENQQTQTQPQSEAQSRNANPELESVDDQLASDVQSAREAAGNSPAGNSAGGSDDSQRLADEVRQANDRALRAQAELENFRRRLRREMDEERRYAALPMISDLLAVVDNLDRAVEASEKEAAEKNEQVSGLLQGVKMVQSQFLSVLERHHCRRIGELGAAFNTNEYQAIGQEPSTQFSAGQVSRVAQYGYRLHDRVVRPAQVFVSTGAPQATTANT